jgi:sigma-B regulation protein RsbU (phosphoserine phosphatase)
LPDQPKIPGYSIAAYMKPADEVGGDYYDVICIDNDDCRSGACLRPQNPGQPQGFAPPGSITTVSQPSYWLAIGDVSGHGVPAGLIMMMVQTAIRAVIEESWQTATPEKILNTVNRVIYGNIQKLDEDKYMSITLMCIFPNGKVYYSGLHQDIIIYRAGRNTVELVETKGVWLGICSQINGLIGIDHLTLYPDDVMLLYTDGITEAVNLQEDMYSHERLIQVLQEYGPSSPQDIKNHIIHSLSDYCCDDDVTLLIIKKSS